MNETPENRGRKILIVTHLFLPDRCGGASIFSDMCFGLADRGMDVTVRCAYPYYPEWTDKSGKNGLRIERYETHGVKVERYGLFIPKNPRSLWQRLLYEGSYFLSLARSLFRSSGFDAVMVLCPLAGSLAFAGLNKLVHRRPLWLNVQDLPADAAAASHIAGGARLQGLLQTIQKLLFNQADVWSSISPIMVERLEGLRKRDQPVLFLPNWLHQSMADNIRMLPSKVGRKPGQPVRLLYAGNIGGKQGLLEFCKELQTSSAPFDFKIHGEGGVANDVREWVASIGDSRFTFGPLLVEEDFVKALHDTDLFVITEKPDSRASFFPSKTVPGIASGTPILAISDPESPLGREMRSQHLGPCFTWEQCGEVVDLIMSLESKHDEFLAWQQNAIRRSHAFDREGCLDFIELTMASLLTDQSISREALGVREAASSAIARPTATV